MEKMEKKFDDWMEKNSEVEIEEIRTPMPKEHYITIIVFYRRPSTSDPVYR